MTKSRRTQLMMTADAVGGVWTYAAELLQALAQRGYQTRLVTMGPRPSVAQREMIAGIPALSVIETDLRLEWQDPESRDTERAAATLTDIAQQFAPDIVHLNSFREAAFDWSCPVVVVAHSCVNTWAHACEATLTGRGWQSYTNAVRSGIHRADAWVAPSAAFGATIRSVYGVELKERVIHNGLAAQSRQSPAKQPIVFGAGRVWDRAKNLKMLAAAADRLAWPVQIAGAIGASGGTITSLPASATYLGELSREATLERMQGAEIFCSPALYEPFGFSVLEAAAAGCALVLSDIATFRELWSDAAAFVDPHDPRAVAGRLNELSSDDNMRRRLQKAASVRARRYSINRTADAYHALYSSLLPEARCVQSMELSA